jgi:hypothetical protein
MSGKMRDMMRNFKHVCYTSASNDIKCAYDFRFQFDYLQ